MNLYTNKYLSRIHIGRQKNISKDSGKIWTVILQIHYVVKKDDRLQYVSLTSNVNKRKEGRDSPARDFTKMDLVVM